MPNIQINFNDLVVDLTDAQKQQMLSAHLRWADDNLNPKERSLYMDRARKTIESIYNGFDVDLRGKNAYGDRRGNVGAKGAAEWADNNTYSMISQISKRGNSPAASSNAGVSGGAAPRTTVNYIRQYLESQFGVDDTNAWLSNSDVSNDDKYTKLLEAVKYGLKLSGRESEVAGVDNKDYQQVLKLASTLQGADRTVLILFPDFLGETSNRKGIRPDYTRIDNGEYGDYVIVKDKQGNYHALDKNQKEGNFYKELKLDPNFWAFTDKDGRYDTKNDFVLFTDENGNLRFGKIGDLELELYDLYQQFLTQNSKLKGAQYVPYEVGNYSQRNDVLEQVAQDLGISLGLLNVADISRFLRNLNGQVVLLPSSSKLAPGGVFKNTTVFVYNPTSKTTTKATLNTDASGVISMTTDNGVVRLGTPYSSAELLDTPDNSWNWAAKLGYNIDYLNPELDNMSVIADLVKDPNKTTINTKGSRVGQAAANVGAGMAGGSAIGSIGGPVGSLLGGLMGTAVGTIGSAVGAHVDKNKEGDWYERARHWFHPGNTYVSEALMDIYDNTADKNIFGDEFVNNVANDPQALRRQWLYTYNYAINGEDADELFEDQDVLFALIYTFWLFRQAEQAKPGTLEEVFGSREAVSKKMNALYNKVQQIQNHVYGTVAQEKEGGVLKAAEGLKIEGPQDDYSAKLQSQFRENQLQLMIDYQNEHRADYFNHNARVGKGAMREDASWNGHDWASLVAGGLDLGAFAGGFVGLGFALAATTLDAINDFTNEEVSSGEALKRLGLNLGLSALAFVPGLAGVKATTKVGKSVVKGAQRVMGGMDQLTGAKRILTATDKVVNEALKAGATPAEAAALARRAIAEGKTVVKEVKNVEGALQVIGDDVSGVQRFAEGTMKYLGKGVQWGMLVGGTAAGVSGAAHIAGDLADGKGADLDDVRSLVGLAGGIKAAKQMLLKNAMSGVTKGISEVEGLVKPGTTTPTGEIKNIKLKTSGDKTKLSGIVDENGKRIFSNDMGIEDFRVNPGETNEAAALRILREKKAAMLKKAQEITTKGDTKTAAENAQLTKLNDDIKLLDDNFLGSTSKIEFTAGSRFTNAAKEKGKGIKNWFSSKTSSIEEPRVLKTLDEIAGKQGATIDDLSRFQRWGYENAKKVGMDATTLTAADDVLNRQGQLVEKVAKRKGVRSEFENRLNKIVEGNKGVESKLVKGEAVDVNSQNAMSELHVLRQQNLQEIRNNKNKISAAKSDVDSATRAINKAQADYDAKLAELDTNEKLVAKYSKLRGAAATRNASKLTKAQDNVTRLKAELAVDKTDLDALKANKQNAESNLKTLQDNITSLNEKNNDIRKNLKDIQVKMRKLNKLSKGFKKNEEFISDYYYSFGKMYDKSNPNFSLSEAIRNDVETDRLLNLQFKNGGILDTLAVKMYLDGGITNMNYNNNDNAFYPAFNETVAANIKRILSELTTDEQKKAKVEEINNLIKEFYNILQNAKTTKYRVNENRTYKDDIIGLYQLKFNDLGFNSDVLWLAFNGVPGAYTSDKKPGEGETYVPDKHFGRLTDHRRVGYFTNDEFDKYNKDLESLGVNWTLMDDKSTPDDLGRRFYLLQIPETPANTVVSEGENDHKNKGTGIVNDGSTTSNNSESTNTTSGTVTNGEGFDLADKEDKIPGITTSDYWIREGMPKLNLAHTNNNIIKGIENELEEKLASRKLPYKWDYHKTTSAYDYREGLNKDKEEYLGRIANIASQTSDSDRQLSALLEGLNNGALYDTKARDIQREAFDTSYALQEQTRQNNDAYNAKIYQQNMQIQNAADQMRMSTDEQDQSAAYQSALAALDGYNGSEEKEKYKETERQARLYDTKSLAIYNQELIDLQNWWKDSVNKFDAEKKMNEAYATYAKRPDNGTTLSKEVWLTTEEGKKYADAIKAEQLAMAQLQREYENSLIQIKNRRQIAQYYNPHYYSDFYHTHYGEQTPINPELMVGTRISKHKKGGTISALDYSDIEKMRLSFETLRKHAEILEKEAERNSKKAQHILDALASRFNDASKVFLK